ncbi:uncharacterized protein (DUF2147 family) [Sphingomonas insulae]|uniref:DUF2147 domain-containing protein n=1 Tax=Sphingomonas insulae TaxID=424800 RepID=A0ABN1HQX6_9SPHN|nr:DUF2147 domain-containing protein [Sphingomonas insulae]NIJ29435.1 uncharacterized protein (DUF2147 family) [Sphingomonas insulae]
MKTIKIPTLAGLAAAMLAPTPAIAATPIVGRWLTEGKTAIVTVAPCGATLCGRITTLMKRPESGPPVDAKNVDPALRGRPLQGLPILTEFSDAGDTWRGRIYDPQTGKTYKSVVSRDADGTLKVQGCIAFLCQTQTWTAVRN